MIEYYGWIALSDSTYESDDHKMELILANIKCFLVEYDMEHGPGLIKIHKVNGSCQILVSGNTNHYSQDVADIFELYNYIALISQGSYGLLYVRNDESKEAYNQFEVFVLARGQIRKENDHFLSPCIPKIEDDEK